MRLPQLDHTHDPGQRSWVPGACPGRTDFPLQNLPLGVFHTGPPDDSRIGIAIGDTVLDVREACRRGLLPLAAEVLRTCGAPDLNALMALGAPASTALRHAAFDLLREGSPQQEQARACLVPAGQAHMQVPARIGDFTDFYTSIHHARRAAAIMRPGAPLATAFTRLPIAYHGRASSVVGSGHPCVRPRGQYDSGQNAGLPADYLPTCELDFELEVGCYIGAGNALGEPVALDDAPSHVFGLCLVNDWSARDMQRWEAQPLGPFLAKSFLTTVSPWVITLQALAPFFVAPPAREPDAGDAPAMLTSAGHARAGGLGIDLQAALQTTSMRQQGLAPHPISATSFAQQYWTLFQMLAHHGSNGCNLRPGDLLSSGTVSGAALEEAGCLLERTLGGTRPLQLPGGEHRTYLHDGDRVTLRATCDADGYVRIGFGECAGTVAAAR